MEITEGHPVPAFDMATDGDGRVSSGALKGKAHVLYFYPKADTPGCTTEGQDFSALADDFAAAGATVIGVSRDPVKKLDRFKAKRPQIYAQMKTRLMTVASTLPGPPSSQECARLKKLKAEGKVQELPRECSGPTPKKAAPAAAVAKQGGN